MVKAFAWNLRSRANSILGSALRLCQLPEYIFPANFDKTPNDCKKPKIFRVAARSLSAAHLWTVVTFSGERLNLHGENR